MSVYTTPCREDGDWATKWGPAGKTARMKAAQDCFNRGFYDAKIIDCGGWRFKAECTNPIPEGWSKPYSSESAQEEGLGDRNAAADASCRSKGYTGSNPNDWRDKGEWFYSIKCIDPVNTSNQQPTLNSQPTIQPAVQPAVQPVPQMIPLAQQPVPFQPEKSNTGLIIGIIVGVLVLLALVIIVVVVVMKNRTVGKASSIAYDNIMYPNL